MKKRISTDIYPIKSKDRIASGFGMFWLFCSGNVLLVSFMVGSAFAELGFIPMIIAAIVANLLGYTMCAWSAQKNSRYGIDEVISHRPTFGFKGSWLGVVLIVGITIGWVGLLAALSGSAGRSAIYSINEGLAFTGDYSVYALGFGILIPLALLLIDPKVGFKLSKITIPIMLFFSILILFRLLSPEYLSVISATEPTGAIGWAFALEVVAAFAVAWLPYIGAWAKFSKTERGGYWGTYLGLTFIGILFAVIGGMATQLTGEIDPVLWMTSLNLGIPAFVIVILGGITTSALLIYAGVMAVLSVFPKARFNIIAIAIVLPSITFIYADSLRSGFDLILLYVGLVAGPYWAIILFDYFFLRKERLNLEACYDPEGPYRYYKGFNLVAVGAQLIGMSVWMYLGGWMFGVENAFFNSGYELFNLMSATIPVMLVSGFTYTIAAKVFYQNAVMGDYNFSSKVEKLANEEIIKS